MLRASVSSTWDQETGRNIPHVLSHFGAGDSGADVTGTPDDNIVPDPNAVIWEIVVSQSTLDAIEDDPDCVVLWSREDD